VRDLGIIIATIKEVKKITLESKRKKIVFLGRTIGSYMYLL